MKQEIDAFDFDIESPHPEQELRSALGREIGNRQTSWSNDHRAAVTELSELVTLLIEEHMDCTGASDETMFEELPPQSLDRFFFG